jgi:hypothetical protein
MQTRAIKNPTPAALVVATAMLLTACGGGGDSTPASSTGTLSINVTDAPVDAARHVWVTFSAIELKPEGQAPITIDIPDRRIDLLALRDGRSEPLLPNTTVPAGRYEWVRVQIVAQQNTNSSLIELLDGRSFPLFVPSGEERGLQLIRGFSVAQGGVTDFTIDFDLRRSVIAPPGLAPNYLLKPVLRLVDSLRIGTISGTVPTSLITSSCTTPFVYVFAGSGVTPDDMDSDPAPDVDPVVSVPVQLNTTTGEWRFRVPFLEVGSYTVAFTCNGGLDTPEGNETLSFTPTVNVTVSANQTVSVGL